MKDFRGVKPLTKKEEQALFVDRWANRDEILLRNYGYVVKVSRLFRGQEGSGMILEDVIQEGLIGLMRAFELFKPERGFRFTTYSTFYIKHYIIRALKTKDKAIRLPIWLHELNHKKNKTEKDMERLEENSNYLKKSIFSLDAGSDAKYQLECKSPLPGEETKTLISNYIIKKLDILDEQEKEILMLVFGIDRDKKTLISIAKDLDMEYQKIIRIKNTAIKKLRKECIKDREIFYD